jgi:hypothetical protein
MSENWNTDPDYRKVHAKRFELSLQWLMPIVTLDAKVLELGGNGAFTKMFRTPSGCQIHPRESDLRYADDNFKSWAGQYDGILCMEVLEHIHDQETQKPTEWRGTGTAEMLRFALEMLKPGGWLFLTTPNVCSHHAIFNALTMAAPAVYRPHVREYAPSEVVALLREAGFTIDRFETVNCWTYGTAGDRERLAAFTEEHFRTDHRGDDIFVIARKPHSA